MVGIQQEHDPLFSYRVNLAERVRLDHPLRAVRAHVDFGFVRALPRPETAPHGIHRRQGHL